MTNSSVSMPLAQVALLALGDGPQLVRESARGALRDHIERMRASHEDVLEAIQSGRRGRFLPFELNDDEQLVACALALSVRESNSSGCAIFSRLSHIDAGVLVIPGRGKISYLDDSAPELDKFAAWFFPSGHGRYVALVDAISHAAKPARLSVAKRVSIEIPVTRWTAKALEKRSVTISFVGATFDSTSADQLRDADAGVTFGEQSLNVEVSRTEAILRMSAAAELGRWLRVESGRDFRAFLRLRPLSSKTRELDAVVSAVELNRQFVFVDSASAIDVPTSLWTAAWPSARFQASALTPIAMSHWQSQGLLPT